MNMNEYIKGYKACLDEFDRYLRDSMKRNGGMVTPGQAWDVMNDVAYFTHQQRLNVYKVENRPAQILVVMGGN